MEIDPTLPVGMAWDDGRGCTAIWFFQVVGHHIHLVNYGEWRNSTLPRILQDLKAWFDRHQFKVGVNVMPHTMRQHSYQRADGISRAKQVRNAFNGKGEYDFIDKPDTVETKFLAGNNVLPFCVFDEEACNDGIICLENYSREAGKDLGDTAIKLFTDKVAKNEYAHGGDAFCELAQSYTRGTLFLKNQSLELPTFAPETLDRQPILKHPRLFK